MTENELKDRTRRFALAMLKVVRRLQKGPVGDTIARQLARSGTSVGANYRSACRARSRADFASKIAIAEEEADESAFWLEVIAEDGLLPSADVAPLLQEANELTAILAASAKTARAKLRKR